MHMGMLGLLVSIALAGCSSKEDPPCTGDECVAMDAGSVDAGAGGTDAGLDAGTDAGPPDAGIRMRPPGPPGETRFYVLNLIDLGAPEEGGDPTVVPGFDLDGRVSDRSDLETCRHADSTSPP